MWAIERYHFGDGDWPYWAKVDYYETLHPHIKEIFIFTGTWKEMAGIVIDLEKDTGAPHRVVWKDVE